MTPQREEAAQSSIETDDGVDGTSRQYYSFSYRLDGQIQYLIWFTDEDDGVYLDADATVPSFSKQEELYEYAQAAGISVDLAESVLLDLDTVSEWLVDRTADTVDCVVLLNAWNLFDDVSRSLGGTFDANRERTGDIYNKLFWGNNIPAMTPEGQSFHPTWTQIELDIMREVLRSGFALFNNARAKGTR
jgi:hypothetical protein